MITQDDIDKLEAAMMKGVRRVSYLSGAVEYSSVDEMLKILTYAKSAIGGDQASMTTLAEYHPTSG